MSETYERRDYRSGAFNKKHLNGGGKISGDETSVGLNAVLDSKSEAKDGAIIRGAPVIKNSKIIGGYVGGNAQVTDSVLDNCTILGNAIVKGVSLKDKKIKGNALVEKTPGVDNVYGNRIVDGEEQDSPAYGNHDHG